MSTVSTWKSSPFDSYREEETIHFTEEHEDIARLLAWECSDRIDCLWNDMFDELQEKTGLDPDLVYFLIQKVNYRG